MIKIDGLNRRYKTNADRLRVIDKISDMRDGDSFFHYKNKFYIQNGADQIDDEKMRKLFVDYKMMNKVIEMFTSFCPDLEPTVTKGRNSSAKTELINKALSSIKWKNVNSQIYDMLESKGDVFYYIYFDEQYESKKKGKKKGQVIPRIRQLDARNMQYIILDDANNPKAYIYKHRIYDEVVNYRTGLVEKRNERDEILIFEKGECHRITDVKDENGELVLDKDGNIVTRRKTIYNDESFKDLIPIIHIPSKKSQDEKFSVIPAEDYVDLCLVIDQIHSDIRAVNRQMGFPRTVLLDCKFVDGDGRIGGIRTAETNKTNEDYDKTNQGQIIDLQLKNGLESTFSELANAVDNLYDIVGITNPTLMNRVSSSDSSKMYNQVNMRMEQKIEGYIDNIIEGFKPFFRILLLANGLYNEKDDHEYSFAKPQSIIKNSAYDDLLIKQLELNTGYKTLYDLLKEKGYTDSEIDNHFDKINEEIRNGKNDISVNKKPVSNQIETNKGGIEE
ncbi:MAG: hypothetical protein ACRC1T_09140 [Clostridium chrysemydis]|uniref:hypothetical protein n=1 Tax=Clostridium chrysemydis TaxID=2665504 RepID=UPI003F3A3824